MSKFVGLIDMHRKAIYVGDLIRTGMRRGDDAGWSVARVVVGDDGLPCLEDVLTGERGQMQWDQELREKLDGDGMRIITPKAARGMAYPRASCRRHVARRGGQPAWQRAAGRVPGWRVGTISRWTSPSKARCA